MIPFAAYTAADSQCFSVGQTTTNNCSFPWRDLSLHLILGSLGPWNRFCRTHECDQETDTQTDHVTPCGNSLRCGL